MSDIKLIQLSNYVRPKLEEVKAKGWVMNGKDNSFYQYVIDRNNGSVTNSVINKSYSNMIYGRGLSAKDASLKVQQWLQFITLLKPSELKKIVSDFQLFGEASMQIVKTKDRKKVAGIYHLPKNLLIPSIENEDGEIESYFYCKDWSKQRTLGYEEFPVFGTSNDEIEVYVIKPYQAGCNYFANPDYLAGLPYCEMEEEIANFCINSIKNGLSAGYIINVPDGQTLTPEDKDEFEKKIKAKLTGSPNATKFVLNFGSKDAEITIIPFPVNEQQHKQWDFLTAESRQQIMTSHAVVSPILFGIKDNTGFGNNADELETSREQLVKYTIQPKQQHLIDAIEEIVSMNDISLDLYFRPLTEAQTPVQMSADEKKKTDLELFLDLGESQDIEGYELESIKAVDYDEEDKIQLSVSTGTAYSNAKSIYDTEFYLYRYRYAGNANPEREFCQRMMGANKIYRREDIELMGEKNVNPGFGMHPTPNMPYSIWKFKGGGLLSANFTGGTCKHYWEKLTYKKIKGIKPDVNSPKAEKTVTNASGIAGIAPHDI
jgi:hypothetical protein